MNNATFLDFTSADFATSEHFAAIARIPGDGSDSARKTLGEVLLSVFFGGAVNPSVTVSKPDPDTPALVVALTLPRGSDPTRLLASDWATRQKALADQDTIWDPKNSTTFGATQAAFDTLLGHVKDILRTSGTDGPGLAPGSADAAILSGQGFTAGARARTIWLYLTPRQFEAIFGTALHAVSATYYLSGVECGADFYAWAGSLAPHKKIASEIRGIWIQQNCAPPCPSPAVDTLRSFPTGTTSFSIGNSAVGPVVLSTNSGALAPPRTIAANYNFPLTAYPKADTAPVGLVETAFVSNSLSLLNAYRAELGQPAYTEKDFIQYDIPLMPNGSSPGEFMLDVSIISDVVPRSRQVIYPNNAGSFFTSYQQAIFDFTNKPGAITSSCPDENRFTPGSPFQTAYDDLFVDAQLRNISVFLSAGDGGSSSQYANGLALLRPCHSVPTAIVVGGTSIATPTSAIEDPTLASACTAAVAGSSAVLFNLTGTGLYSMPDPLSAQFTTFTETVWNEYAFVAGQNSFNATYDMNPDFTINKAGSGGVATNWSTPDYQRAFGCAPVSVNPDGKSGRGVPDVSALAGGDAYYEVINQNYDSGTPGSNLLRAIGGTSSATPLWAALATQINAVFHDHGLPRLGFFNDILYQAAALNPGAFNDIVAGNNASSFYYYPATATQKLSSGNVLIYGESSSCLFAPTGTAAGAGLGYSAGPGYDLATGLGSPNGLLLARTLAAIAHQQTTYGTSTAAFTAITNTDMQSATAQSLLVQATGAVGTCTVRGGTTKVVPVASPANSTACTNRLANQLLQERFEPGLLENLDFENQGLVGSLSLAKDEKVSVSLPTGIALTPYQAALTAPFGFATFGGQTGGVTLARPVAVALTAKKEPGQKAIVRMRRVGAADMSLSFYRVDDFRGAIGSALPGSADYAKAVEKRLYGDGSDQTSFTVDKQYGLGKATLNAVTSGDIIAMRLTSGSNTFWGFAAANDTVDGVPVGRLWSYGLNTWGWAAGSGTAFTFTDLIVQLDFISATGTGLLA